MTHEFPFDAPAGVDLDNPGVSDGRSLLDELPDPPTRPAGTSIDAAIKFTIDPVAILGTVVAHDEYGNVEYDVSTLRDEVIAAAGEALANQIGREWRRSIAADARDRFDKVANQEIRRIITEALDRTVQKTDNLGSPEGEPTKVEKLIVEAAEKWAGASDGGYGNDRKTRLQKIVDEAIDREFTKKLKGAVTAAETLAIQQVSTRSGKIIEQAVAELIKERGLNSLPGQS